MSHWNRSKEISNHTFLYGNVKILLCLVLVDIAACDITLNVTDTKQYIATEGYPISYMNDQNCEFNFVAPPGRRFFVIFEDFDLEEDFDFIILRMLHIIYITCCV